MHRSRNDVSFPTGAIIIHLRRRTMKWTTALAALAALAMIAPAQSSAAEQHSNPQTVHGASASNPSLGSNVIIFTPAMSQTSIQSELNTISNQQVPNQFGKQRYSIFFEPGTYG